MTIKRIIDKNLIGLFLGLGMVLFLFVFFITCTQIGYDVKKRCALAQSKYGGECVDALMSQVADESNQSGKNGAIWALGQLGDRQALPFLEKYYTGQKDQGRVKWSEGISQYELNKAIKLLRSGFNLSAFVWRD